MFRMQEPVSVIEAFATHALAIAQVWFPEQAVVRFVKVVGSAALAWLPAPTIG